MKRCKHQFPYEYFLSLEYQGFYEALEIDREDYERLDSARRSLSGALSMERKFDILMLNFADFESALNQCHTLLEQYEPGDLWGSHELHRLFGTRITNLLSSARMYIDHSKSDIKSCSDDPLGAKLFLERQFSNHYDNNKYYRLMEALRNHAQHKSVPVNNVSLVQPVSRAVDPKKDVKLFVNKVSLLRNKKFKKEVLDEFSERPDIKLAVYEYINSLCEIHSEFRNYCNDFLDEAREVFDFWITEYKKIENRYFDMGLKAIHKKEKEEAQIILVDTGWDNVRMRLAKRNRGIEVPVHLRSDTARA